MTSRTARLAATNGDDFIVGGPGNDTIDGGNGADQLYGDDGDDIISGSNGRDIIDGGPGNDIISGGNGPDEVFGGSGNDVIVDSRGPDTVDGGDGTDSCGGTSCELPDASACASSSDCAVGERCTGSVCIICQSDSECDDHSTCTGVESCVPVAGCQVGTNLPDGHDIGVDCRLGVGACQSFGPTRCDGAGGNRCDAIPLPPSPDIDCDGLDDDCDGTADESFESRITTCGLGACVGSGATSCMGVLTDTCLPGPPSIEVCDGADNDCNGFVDDGLLDTDGDSLCDGPTVDGCPFHSDVTVLPGDIVIGRVLCDSPDSASPMALGVPSLPVRTPLGNTQTDCTGTYTIVVPSGSTLNPGTFPVQFSYNGTVPGPDGSGTIMRVVDDLGHPWGTDLFHFGFGINSTATVSTDPVTGRRTLNVDPITIATSECELYRIGVAVVDSYQQAMRRTTQRGNLTYMRRAGVFGTGPYTPFDYVDLPSDILAIRPDRAARTRTMFHESGHVFRHIADGDHIHWDNDNVRFIYARCHWPFGIIDEGFAFNEGWAQYWAQARLLGRARLVGPDAVTGTCGGTVGSSGVLLTPEHVDWVENMIADRILDIADDGCAGATPDQADAALVRMLEANPGTIHSLFEFETRLCESGLCCDVVRSTAPDRCPPAYDDHGLTCGGPGGHVLQHTP